MHSTTLQSTNFIKYQQLTIKISNHLNFKKKKKKYTKRQAKPLIIYLYFIICYSQLKNLYLTQSCRARIHINS